MDGDELQLLIDALEEYLDAVYRPGSIELTKDELQLLVDALEEYLDAVYRSDSSVAFRYIMGQEIWRLRNRLSDLLFGDRLSDLLFGDIY